MAETPREALTNLLYEFPEFLGTLYEAERLADRVIGEGLSSILAPEQLTRARGAAVDAAADAFGYDVLPEAYIKAAWAGVDAAVRALGLTVEEETRG